MSQMPPREAVYHTAGVKMATYTPAAVISTTWLFVLRIKETNLKKDDREKLQIIELQALTPGGKGRNLLRLLSNNWKSAIASCFFLPNINLATLFM